MEVEAGQPSKGLYRNHKRLLCHEVLAVPPQPGSRRVLKQPDLAGGLIIFRSGTCTTRDYREFQNQCVCVHYLHLQYTLDPRGFSIWYFVPWSGTLHCT